MEFEAVIGLEIHAQISTKTKMFCRCDNDSFGKDPNVNTCPVCMGFPGQLPVMNKIALAKGIRASLALQCEVLEHSKFDRKNYFYPDNPKGFQISQFDEPLAVGGKVTLENGYVVRITRLHLEDDAGKLTHVSNGSLVDYNRSGTPLMEIVTEPDLHNSADAVALAREIQKILRYVESSEADMEKGMMRFDASVSIRPVGETKLYPRAEIKNLNSFKALEAAIDYEIKRQVKAWQEEGPATTQTTVGWNDDKKQTYFLREKEDSDDYRYFPEPDIPPISLTRAEIDLVKSDLPELPAAKRLRYVNEFGLSEADAKILSDEIKLARYFEDVVAACGDAKKAFSFMTTILLKYLNEDGVDVDQQKVTPAMLSDLIAMVNSGEISYNTAKGEVFEEMYATGKVPGVIAQEKGLKQVSDSSAIEAICRAVVEANPGPVEDVKNGKEKAIGFLVGQVMKESKGQANPQLANDLLKKVLGL